MKTSTGWWLSHPSEKELIGRIIPYMKWKKKTCLKPPSSLWNSSKYHFPHPESWNRSCAAQVDASLGQDPLASTALVVPFLEDVVPNFFGLVSAAKLKISHEQKVDFTGKCWDVKANMYMSPATMRIRAVLFSGWQSLRARPVTQKWGQILNSSWQLTKTVAS